MSAQIPHAQRTRAIGHRSNARNRGRNVAAMAVEWSAMNVGGEVEEEAAVEGEMNVPDTHPRHVFIALSRSLSLSLSSLSLSRRWPSSILTTA